MHRFMDMGQK